MLPVPHTQPWFAGVANLRGGLHGVVDLAAFLGLRAARRAADDGCASSARLVALNPSLGVNCALLVDRLAGPAQRRTTCSRATPTTRQAQRPAFAGARWRDADGRSWQEIELAALAADEQFLGDRGLIAGGTRMSQRLASTRRGST